MNIEFIPSTKDVELLVAPPEPTKTIMPDWYKNIKPPAKSINGESDHPRKKLINLKSCTPFLDAMTSGYIQRTWADLFIDQTNGKLEYYVPSGPEMIGHRDHVSVPIGTHHSKIEFYWTVPWIPKLPKGYSVLMTHPFNQLNLNFTVLSAIIDADDFYHVGMGQYPFYLNKDFNGLIPMGTPMYQIIPFRRDNWKKSISKFDEDIKKVREFTYLREIWGVYKNKFWKKKNYD
jgi:hypothetical protein